MNSDDEDLSFDRHKTPPKKLKSGPKCFSDDWLKLDDFKGWLQKVPDNCLKARCTACQSDSNNIMPPKKKENQTKANKENVEVTNINKKRVSLKRTSKTKGKALKKNEQINTPDKSIKMNLTVVWNEKNELLGENTKPVAVKDKKKTTISNKKLEEKKVNRNKTEKSTGKNVEVKIPRKENVQVRNLRKRNNAESPAVESKVTKVLKFVCKETQVTPSMIDEEMFKINIQYSGGQVSGTIFKNENINKQKTNESGILFKPEKHEIETERNATGRKHNRNKTTGEMFDQEKNLDVFYVNDIILISSDEEY